MLVEAEQNNPCMLDQYGMCGNHYGSCYQPNQYRQFCFLEYWWECDFKNKSVSWRLHVWPSDKKIELSGEAAI